jgi:hypothetical protein
MPRSVSLVGLAQRGVIPQNNSTSERFFYDPVVLERGGETMGIAGRPQSYSVARGLAVSFAGYRTIVDAQVVEAIHGGCGPDGLLGRDALARCALLFSRRAVAITCS